MRRACARLVCACRAKLVLAEPAAEACYLCVSACAAVCQKCAGCVQGPR